jgi:hypothetical protein
MFRAWRSRRKACFREIRLLVAYASIGTKKIRADFTRGLRRYERRFERIFRGATRIDSTQYRARTIILMTLQQCVLQVCAGDWVKAMIRHILAHSFW